MLEIEKELNITVNFPQNCVLCKKEITKSNGSKGDDLCFHSTDGNHDNWSWDNKVPMHNRCHLAYHSMSANTDRHKKASFTKFSYMPYNTDEERALYTIRRLRSNEKTATKTRIMQATGWRKDKTAEILNDMVEKNLINRCIQDRISGRQLIHYVDVDVI